MHVIEWICYCIEYIKWPQCIKYWTVELISYVDASTANRKHLAVTWPPIVSYRKLHETTCEFHWLMCAMYIYCILKLHGDAFSAFSALNPIMLFVVHWESGLWSDHHQVRHWNFLQESVNLKHAMFNEVEWRLLCVLLFKSDMIAWPPAVCLTSPSTLPPKVACRGESVCVEGSSDHIAWAEFKAVCCWELDEKLITPCLKKERDRYML